MRTRVRLLLAAVLLGALLPVLPVAPAHAGTLHGHRPYTPAMAWRAADGATITVNVTYVIEEFPEGCRGGVLVSGARNGQPWALNYAAKGGSESVWHYHAGQSREVTIDC